MLTRRTIALSSVLLVLVTAAPASAAPAGPQVARSVAQRTLDGMSLRERVGQLIMVDCPTSGLNSATRSAITRRDVGAVILDGTSTAGRARIRSLTRRAQRLAPRHVGLFVATDQEGGGVQRLQGHGFRSVPSALRQGRRSPAGLHSLWRQVGYELRRAGVNVNLAPVLDTVPRSWVASNQPIGQLDREYGHTPSRVRSHTLPVLRALASEGVDATGKHFPGLGRVRGNTDTTHGVTDRVTGPHSSFLRPFRAAAGAGIPFMMISNAIYAKLDPHTPAPFSHPIVTGLLRHDLGFRGVIISDDLGSAKAVAGRSPGARAVDFVRAGGDIVLTVVASDARPMTAALVARARTSASFRRKVNAAALKVLEAKHGRGLLR